MSSVGRLRDALAAEGIDVAGLRTVPGAASGLALITVDPAGENVIAVAPGANGLAGEVEVAAAFSAPCDVLVLSAEIPVAVLAAALRRANARGGERGEGRVRTVLNLAPVPEEAALLLAARPDWLVVNAHEAGVLLGAGAADVAQAQAMAARLAAGEAGPGAGAGSLAGPGSGAGPEDRYVVITLGAAGAVLAGPAVTAAIGGFSVPAVDTVGAGDAFVGALAVALAARPGPRRSGARRMRRGGGGHHSPGSTGRTAPKADVLAATGFRWPEIAD